MAEERLSEQNFAGAAELCQAELTYEQTLQGHDLRTIAMWLHGAYEAGRAGMLPRAMKQVYVRPLVSGEDASIYRLPAKAAGTPRAATCWNSCQGKRHPWEQAVLDAAIDWWLTQGQGRWKTHMPAERALMAAVSSLVLALNDAGLLGGE